MSKITPEDVRKVAKLARLAIPEDQIATYSNQLEKILTYVAQLEQVNTTDVPPTTRAVEVINVNRSDEILNTSVREELLELAPQRQEDFYRVPKILSE